MIKHRNFVAIQSELLPLVSGQPPVEFALT
jgi:hypothetical protein